NHNDQNQLHRSQSILFLKETLPHSHRPHLLSLPCHFIRPSHKGQPCGNQQNHKHHQQHEDHGDQQPGGCLLSQNLCPVPPLLLCSVRFFPQQLLHPLIAF